MPTNELKPCPFCGVKPTLWTACSLYVECSRCKVRMTGDGWDDRWIDAEKAKYKLSQKLIDLWNTRTEPPKED